MVARGRTWGRTKGNEVSQRVQTSSYEINSGHGMVTRVNNVVYFKAAKRVDLKSSHTHTHPVAV